LCKWRERLLFRRVLALGGGGVAFVAFFSSLFGANTKGLAPLLSLLRASSRVRTACMIEHD